MKIYPSIQYYTQGRFGSMCYVFDKLDGQNLRFEWSKKSGWYKYGTRNSLFDESNKEFGKAIPLFLSKYSKDIDLLFRKEKQFRNSEHFTVFCEYVGENSFIGRHELNDKMDIILFDIFDNKKGFVLPSDFVDISKKIHTVNFLGKHEYTNELIHNIHNNNFQNYNLKEGVVCKGILNTKSEDNVWMVKIKTKDWLSRLKNMLGDKGLLDEVNGDSNLLIV